jgi:hypothetical protein
MNKAELLQDIESRVIRVIKVEEQEDPVKNEAGIKSYIANVLNLDQGRVQGQNIGFYVVDEGEPTERAYFRDNAGSRVALEAETVAFIQTLPYVRVQVQEVDSSNEFVIARAFEETAEGIQELRIMLYKDADGTPQHKKLA